MIDIQAIRDEVKARNDKAGYFGVVALELCDEVDRLRGRWISVDERLPEKQGFYLTARKTGNVGKTFFYTPKYRTGKLWGGYSCWTSVTYWMPLPEPPEDKP